MKKILLTGAVIGALSLTTYLVTSQDQKAMTANAATPAEGAPIVEVTVPDQLSSEAQIGKVAFDAVCAKCHGDNASGKMGFGPPLIHPIYEPNHHGDMAFQMAVQNGAKAHHWRFGNMPPQEGLTAGDVSAIVTYVREVQRANGIQ